MVEGDRRQDDALHLPETGHLGIHFLELHDLAWKVAGPRLLAAGRTRIPEDVDLALLLAEGQDATQGDGTPTYLKNAAGMSGFAPAALRNFLILYL